MQHILEGDRVHEVNDRDSTGKTVGIIYREKQKMLLRRRAGGRGRKPPKSSEKGLQSVTFILFFFSAQLSVKLDGCLSISKNGSESVYFFLLKTD